MLNPFQGMKNSLIIGKGPTKTVSNRHEKYHAHFHINQHAIINIALRLSKHVVFNCNMSL